MLTHLFFPGSEARGPRESIRDCAGRWISTISRSRRAAKSDEGAYAIPMGGKFKLPFGELTVSFNERDLIWAGFRMKDFVPAADLEVRGLRNRYRTPGIGAALAASIEPLEGEAGKQSMRIPPRLKIPVTAFLRLEDPRAALASGKLTRQPGILHSGLRKNAQDRRCRSSDRIRNDFGPGPDSGRGAGLGLRDRRVSAPATSPSAAQICAKDCSCSTRTRRGRMPVVLVHGTASSPARWAELINELENDPRFWEDYEIWLFMYNTGNPVAYSAMLLRDALNKVVKELDPDNKDTGLKRMVVAGHSQGGLLTKMTAIDSGTRLWPFSVPPEELDIDVETRDLLTHALMIKPLPFVRRVIFIATPHRGSYQALGILGSFASWMVNLPGRFTKLSLDLLTLQGKGFVLGPKASGLPTSIDNMNPTNRFIVALSAIPIADGVVANSIVGVDGGGPPAEGGDGVVKYSSAHIEGVESEKIVNSPHSMQGNPETIQEVKRILIKHANSFP